MSIAVVYDLGAASAAEIVQSLGEDDEIVMVFGFSEHAQSMAEVFAEDCLATYGIGDPGLAAALAGHGVEGVVTYSERMLEATAELAAQAGLVFHSPQVIANVTNKAKQRTRLREAGVDALTSILLTSIDAWEDAIGQTGVPAVVKPVRGDSSRSTVMITDGRAGRETVERLLAAEGALLVEEMLRGAPPPDPCFGDYVSVESAVLPDGTVHYAVTGKFRLAPPFRETGQFWPAYLDEAAYEGVIGLADGAIVALGITTGIVHTEIKLTATGPRVIEVNGRMGGLQPELAARATDLDMIRIAADIALGRPVKLEPTRPEGVTFQLWTPGPARHGILRTVAGAEAVRRIPGVARHRTVLLPGTEVGGTSTNSLALTFGAVQRHDLLPDLVAAVTAELSYEFEMDGQLVTYTGADLLVRE